MESIDVWCRGAIQGLPVDEELARVLSNEPPELMSVTFERGCSLQCQHCIYQPEPSSAQLSLDCQLDQIIYNLAGQIPGSRPSLLHEGRILLPSHVSIMRKVKRLYPHLHVGLIDNGTYVRHLALFDSFRLDWIDISLDGCKQSHNLQRGGAPQAYHDAMRGLEVASQVSNKVGCLFTLTSINYQDLEATADLVLPDLADEFHVTMVNTVRPEMQHCQTTAVQLKASWAQFQKVKAKWGRRAFFRIYAIEDFMNLAAVVGPQTVWRALQPGTLTGTRGRIQLNLDGTEIAYYPTSLASSETFVVDANGMQITPLAIKYTLLELERGYSSAGESTHAYRVGKLSPNSSFLECANRCARHWWTELGRSFFSRERQEFEKLQHIV